jgi:ribonucleoside-diphosphate reductase alpha chain
MVTHLHRKKKGQFEIAEDSSPSQKPKGMYCKECEGHGIFDEGGCLVCKDCGWSKCE